MYDDDDDEDTSTGISGSYTGLGGVGKISEGIPDAVALQCLAHVPPSATTLSFSSSPDHVKQPSTAVSSSRLNAKVVQLKISSVF
ncbi:uncharacterized protein A4U43_C06F13280 [Asparagus officinalis]|uniref:Uncharacterized protein n=1 Tax=Asparagus officinalis TaxID=4686 RepID=A0A5P1EQR2_ASPOF|nr:uncharacterized protein A4U43_C06F13280 [Asparagus officinalis]